PLKRQLEDLFPNREKTRSALTAAIDAGDTAEVERLTAALKDQNDQWQALYDRFIEGGPALREALGILSGADLAHAGTDRAMADAAKIADQLAKTEAQRKAMAEGVAAAVEKQKEAYAGMVETFAGFQGLDSRTMTYGMSSFAGEAAKAGIAMQSVQTAASDVFRIIVENTNGVSDLASKTLDWADALIGAPGTVAEIDRLLADGLITQQQWNDAQTAYNSIAQDTAKIQDYTLQIQAKQAPIIAQQTAALEKQYGIIANMEGQQQLAALGWMDSAEAAKALEINAMAADVAAGRMGASGKAGFEEMLQAAVLMDPALGAMLDKMGLIKLAADGTTILEIDYDQAAGAESEIAKLTESINALILALGGIPPLNVDTVGLMTAEQRVKALQAAWDQLTTEDKQTFFDKLGQGAESSGGKLQRTAEDAKALNDAITAIGTGTTVDVDTDAAQRSLEAVADHFRQLDGATATGHVDVEDGGAEGAMETLRRNLEGMDGKTVSVKTRFDQTGKDDVQNAVEQLGSLDGRVVTITTRFQTEGSPSDLSRYDQGGRGDAIGALEIPVKYGALPPLELPTPQPVIVPVQFSMATSGGLGPTAVPGGMESALGGAASGGGITIAVSVAVTGTEQLDALKQTIEGLSNKTITTSVAVNGAELIGALKLDVQNLSNKTVTIMVAVSGADAIATLKSDLEGIENATVTLTILGDAANAGAAYTTISTLPDVTKWLFIFGDATNAGSAYTTISTLLDVTKWLFIFGDASEAGAAYTTISTLPDVSKWLFIFGDNSEALAAHDEVTKLSDVTKTLTINVVTNGTIPPALATGGTVPRFDGNKTIARMAELGPELFRTPTGKWGMAMTDGLYPMTPGTYVFTAAQSRRMWEQWTGRSYARGGTVRRDYPTRAERSRYGAGGGGTTIVTVHSAPNITVNPQTRVTEQDLDYIMTEVSDAAVTAVETARYAKGGS
ncbi:MAG: hypothetical protein WBA46_10055, partial [Thermomicrobiales bacterium]